MIPTGPSRIFQSKRDWELIFPFTSFLSFYLFFLDAFYAFLPTTPRPLTASVLFTFATDHLDIVR